MQYLSKEMKPTGLQLEAEMEIIYNNATSLGDVIAVGDIHGRLDLLDVFLESVRDTQTTVILLGDLLDRGPDDLGVLLRVEKLLEEPGLGLRSGLCATRQSRADVS